MSERRLAFDVPERFQENIGIARCEVYSLLLKLPDIPIDPATTEKEDNGRIFLPRIESRRFENPQRQAQRIDFFVNEYLGKGILRGLGV